MWKPTVTAITGPHMFYTNTITEQYPFFSDSHQISANLYSGSYPESSNNVHKHTFFCLFLNWSRNISKLPTSCYRKIICWEKRYTIQRARIPFGKSKIRYNYWALPFSCQTYKFFLTANSSNTIQFVHPPSPSLCPQVLHCKLSYNPIL